MQLAWGRISIISVDYLPFIHRVFLKVNSVSLIKSRSRKDATGFLFKESIFYDDFNTI